MATEGARKAIQILLVEDSPTDRLLTVDALERSGLTHSLSVVQDGLEAMAYLHKEGKFAGATRPDLVLLDLNLPSKDGREVLAEVKADPRLKYIPIIVMTTSRSDEDLLRAYGHHANGYITKPIDFAQLAEALRTLGGYWFNVMTLPTDSLIERLPIKVASNPPPARDAARLRALLIADNPVTAHAIETALTANAGADYEVEQAATFSDAAQAAGAGRFDLVLLDLEQREAPGLEAYRRTRRLAGGAPVIVFTENEAEGGLALQDGADDHLPKAELSAGLLARSVRYVLRHRHDRERLRRAQKLEALGRLAAGAAHDFNNLLSVVKGSAELLSRADTKTGIRAELVLGIHDAADRAGVIARQLLALSRQRPMSPQPVELNQVIGGFTRLLRHMLGDTIHLELHLASELPLILADASMLDQVLLNLAINARDAMPSGGKFRIRTARVEVARGAKGLNPSAYPGHFVQLIVSDTGTGIPPDVLAHVFEPFFTTKANRDGTGLGLAMVQSIVQQHHGWLDVNSQPDAGTSFSIFLPVTAPIPSARTAPNQRPKVSSTPTILFVEEEAMLRSLATTVLQQQGYRVLEASSEAEALCLWSECGPSIDLVVTEIALDDGATHLSEVLSQARPALPFIFTGGSARNSRTELEEGVDFLQKPYALSHLVQTVRQCLAPQCLAPQYLAPPSARTSQRTQRSGH